MTTKVPIGATSGDNKNVVRRNSQLVRSTVGVSLTLPIDLNANLTRLAVQEKKTRSLLASELLEAALTVKLKKVAK